MAKGKTTSKTQQNNYATYKTNNKFAVNRKRKLLKLQKEQPNNEQIALALKNISYRRGTPNTAQWSHTSKEYAQVSKQFKKGSALKITKVSERQMFSLGERAGFQWNT